MRYVILSTLLFVLCFSTPGQTAAPSPSPKQKYELRIPQKPDKEPVTAADFVEWARWEYFNRNSKIALDYLNQALKRDESDIDALLLRGYIKASRDDCRSAINDFTSVISLAERPFNTYQARGECKVRLKDFQGALVDFDKSVDILKQDGKVQYNAFIKRGKLKYILRDYDGAVRDFKGAFNIGGSSSAAFYAALTNIKAGKMAPALEDLNYLASNIEDITRQSRAKFPEMYREEPGYPWDEDIFATTRKASVGGAGIAVGVAAVGRAGVGPDPLPKLAEFDDMIVLDNWFFPSEKMYFDTFVTDNSELVFFLLGQLYAGKNDIDRAIMAYSAGLASNSLTSENGRIRFERGKLYLLSGNFEAAVRDFSWAISKKKKVAEAYVERAVALTMMNRDDLAKKDLDVYKSMMPNNASVADKRISEARQNRTSSP